MTTRFPDPSNGLDLNDWLKRESQELDHYFEIAKRRAEENVRRERLMRRLAVISEYCVVNCMTYGGVFLLALLCVGWLNPQQVDAILLLASLACAAMLGACLFSIAYWFFNLRS